MDAGVFFRGLAIGFSIAAPVGQIGILCIRRTLAEGRAIGLASGFGAATADLFYGTVAAFGLTFISDFIQAPTVQLLVKLIGGLFLCYLGIRIFRSTPADEAATAKRSSSLFGAYASTFALTITNPATIVLYTGVFAALNVATGDYGSAALIVAGVFAGSMLWWVILSSGVTLLRTRLNGQMLRVVNVVSGLILIAFGVAALISLFAANASASPVA
ncbi:MAG: LysE family translocator [Anaerolineae bacterium]|nr:LysE family translocator [Anaerolineae bacterium]